MPNLAASFPADIDFVEHALSGRRWDAAGQARVAELGFCTLGVATAETSSGEPMQASLARAGSPVVVVDGAVYNSHNLTRELGMPSDAHLSEVIAVLYERVGPRFADHLEGMFAVCIADRTAQAVVIAVDPVGIKPLYRCEMGSSTYVASTIDAFPRTLWSRVHRVPPGSVWSSTREVRRIGRARCQHGDIGALITAAVDAQLPANGRWACTLSGGVDSSLIAALAVEQRESVTTLTCGIAGPDLDAARYVADLLGTDHHEVVVAAPELDALLEEVVVATASCDQEVVMTGVGYYVAARAASERGIETLLAGTGADELFGGYIDDVDVPLAFLDHRLVRSQFDLGSTGCLGLDRTSRACGVEARVPYLDTSLMRLARSLPPDQKIRRDAAGIVSKFALREFAATLLPPAIAAREKVGFPVGAGLSTDLIARAESRYSTHAVAELRGVFPAFPITDAFSALVFDLWRRHYGPDLATSWSSLVERGLARQASTPYLPGVSDPMSYDDARDDG